MPTRDELLPHVSYCVDTALAERPISELAAHPEARLVAFAAGFEPMVVGVFDCYVNDLVDEETACELAIDLLLEKSWFAGGDINPIAVV